MERSLFGGVCSNAETNKRKFKMTKIVQQVNHHQEVM